MSGPLALLLQGDGGGGSLVLPLGLVVLAVALLVLLYAFLRFANEYLRGELGKLNVRRPHRSASTSTEEQEDPIP